MAHSGAADRSLDNQRKVSLYRTPAGSAGCPRMGWMTSVKRSRTGAGSPAALRRAIACQHSIRKIDAGDVRSGWLNDCSVVPQRYLSTGTEASLLHAVPRIKSCCEPGFCISRRSSRIDLAGRQADLPDAFASLVTNTHRNGVSGDLTRRHHHAHQGSDRSGHHSRNRFGCVGGDQAEQQQSQLGRVRLPRRVCRLDSQDTH